MFYWPRPHEFRFQLSPESARRNCEIIEASVLAVERCWCGSKDEDYIIHTRSYHDDAIDRVARDSFLENVDQISIPEVQMLGNSHLCFRTGAEFFSLFREMALLGYIDTIPFALTPCDADKFSYYFRPVAPEGWRDVPIEKCPLIEQPVLKIYGS